MDGHGYRMTDLISATGVSPTTIRRWIWQGIVTGAIKRGRYSYYSRETKDQIIAARDAYEGNMTWRDIKDRLHPPDDDGAVLPER